MRVIPGSARIGNVPRSELTGAAPESVADGAGLIVAGETTLEKGFDEAVTAAAKVVKAR